MGMYDIISGTVKCPYCGKKTLVTDQIKWTEDPWLNYYKVGDHIDAADGTYDAGSWVRDRMHSPCTKCGEDVSFSVVVKNEIVTEILPYIASNIEDECEGEGLLHDS